MKLGRRLFCAAALLCLAAMSSRQWLLAQEPAAKAESSDALPGLISKAQLSPALISHLREMRFSPNGASLLMQDDSSAYVIGTNPLAMRLNLSASQILPMRFSSDSQELVAATRNMVVVRYKIADRSRTEQKILGGGGECYAATLSNDGELYACLDKNSDLRFFA
ncbi:MAG: hypothetical protein WBQ34_15235 [Candidatus Acidiferrales bacterium]